MGLGNGAARGFQGVNLNVAKQMYDIWIRTSSEALEAMVKTPSFVAAMGNVFTQSLDFKRHMDEVLDTTLKSMQFSTGSDTQAMLSELRAIQGTLTQISTAVGALTIEHGKTLDHARRRDEALQATLNSLRSAIEFEVKAAVSELKTLDTKLAQPPGSSQELADRIARLESQLGTVIDLQMKMAQDCYSLADTMGRLEKLVKQAGPRSE